MTPPWLIKIDLDVNSSVYYGKEMEVPDSQILLQAYSDKLWRGNGSFIPQLLHADLFEGLESMPSNLENIFDDCFPREYLVPQTIARPSTLPPIEGDKSDMQTPAQPNPNESPIIGVGDGPLPADFGMPSVYDRNSSTPLDFTKRRNWSQRIIEEIRDFLHVLTPDGRMIYLSPSVEPITGYAKAELKGKFIVDFVHPDDKTMFLQEFNESIANETTLRCFYRFLKKDQTYIIFEAHGHPHFRVELGYDGSSSYSNTCRGYFMMARPYLTKNSTLLDSFLEHKIENLRLSKRIEELRKEEELEEEAQQKWLKQADQFNSRLNSPVGSNNTSQSQMSLGAKHNDCDSMSMPPPARPVGAPLTKKALEQSNAGLGPDSIKDKMERYEGTARIESIEMLTGLRYKEGERSYGISTGAQSPLLIKGDAGISLPQESETRGEKKRKNKIEDDYVCTDCGTLDSPEWRKGPSGPKTLCNACGLRWAKKEKKKPSYVVTDRTAQKINTEPIFH